MLCTDNYPLNVSIFKLFSMSKIWMLQSHILVIIVVHFPLFDFIHILKSIHNNWLNIKDFNKMFRYPQFENFDITDIALSEDVRLLYRSEHNSASLS